MRFCLFALLILLSSVLHAQPNPDWTTPLQPFRIAGNLYYVGSRDLAAYLVTTPAGNILINSNLESSPPQIHAAVEQLGFKWADTKILLSSQAHYDHVAGAAQVLRETHAKYEVMEGDVKVVEQGGGPASFDLPDSHFPRAHVDKVLHDGDKITLGGATVVAFRTAGHTQGCTTFTIRVTEGGKELLVVIVGGWSSNPGVRYVSAQGKPASYPDIVQDFEHTFATYESLPADIFLGAHGVYFNMLGKLDKGAGTNPSQWIDRDGYKAAIAKAHANFEAELAKQKAVRSPQKQSRYE
jgi:metallo-beta-lactamase class B